MDRQHLPTVPQVVTSCDGCGACCHNMGHPIWISRNERDVIPSTLRIELDSYLDERRRSGLGDDYGQTCMWFDPVTKQCRNYEYRPEVCRDFEVGGDDCLEVRQMEEERDAIIRK